MADENYTVIDGNGDPQVFSADDVGAGVLAAKPILRLATGTVAAGNPVPVTAASLPLPTGAATETTLASIDTKVATQTTLAAIETLLGSPLAVTGPLTDTQLRASAVPVSAASLPLPTGAATETTLASALTALQLIDNAVSGTGFNISQIAGSAARTLDVNEAGGTDIYPAFALVKARNGTGTVVGDSNPLPVEATNLDIRDLSSSTDSVTAIPGINSSTTSASMAQGVKTVSATGTPERLVVSTLQVDTVFLQAMKGFNSANSSAVYIGFSAVNDSNYIQMLPGDSLTFTAPSGKKLDLNLFYIEVTTNGDGVSYTWMA